MEPSPGDEFRFLQAAVLVEDALHRRKLPHRLDSETLPLYIVHASTTFQLAMKFVVYFNMLLVFFEDPGANLLAPVAVTLSLEFVFQVFYIVDVAMRYKFLEPGRFYKDIKNRGMIAVIVLTLLDMVAYIVVQLHFGVRYPRFSRVLRVFYFVYYHQAVRMSFRDLRKAMPQIADAFVLLFTFLLIASAFFMVFFYQRVASNPFGDSNYTQIAGDPSSYYEQYWAGFGTAFTSSYVLMTTENFPDIMMQPYGDSGWNSAPFVVFLIMVKALMLNILMAVIFSTYRTNMRDEVRRLIKFEHTRMVHAFKLVVGENGQEMGSSDWQRLFHVLRPGFSLRKVQLLFQIIDEDDDGTISLSEFARTIELLDMTIKPADEYRNLWEKIFPNFYSYRPINALRHFVQHRLFQYLADIAIIANVVTILVLFGHMSETGQSDDDADDDPRAFVDHVHISEIVFFALFIIDALLKVFAHGPRKFWKNNWNKFDVATLVAISISFGLVAQGYPRIILRVVMLLRIIRMFRIFSKFKRFDTTMKTMGALFPVFISNSALMMCTYYVFIIIGIESWGGLITLDSFDPSVDYWSTGYFPNTFNTFGQGIIMMITLTIVNNWNTTITAFVAVSNSMWVWVFFIASHICCVILIENVFAAFVIEFFFRQLELEAKPRHDAIEDRIMVLCSRGRISTHGGNLADDNHVAEWIVKQPTTQRHTQRLMFAEEITELEQQMDDQTDGVLHKASKAYIMEDLRLLSSAVRSGWRRQAEPADITAISGSIAQLGQASAMSANVNNTPEQDREIRLKVVQKNPTFRDY
eukprot:TRINITY_DN3409_c0_g1_i1.p1 TRINITY_DN3409_c0_g1~~TRINITY_DN3409_c0_g1_i1.p1  ORF type:complete len:806 (+),score=258.60 TRINITY_DN3409_c0_g1_i1:127-2544(+)